MKKSLLKRSILTVVIKGVAVILNFGLSIFLARKFGPEGLGKYAFAHSFILVLSMFGRFGMDGYLLKEIPRLERGEKEELFYNAVVHVFIISSLILVFFQVFLSFYGGFLNNLVLEIMLWSSPLFTLIYVFASKFRAEGRPVLANAVIEILKYLIILFSLEILFQGNRGLSVIGYSFTLYVIISLMFCLVLFRGFKVSLSRFNISKSLLSKSFPFFLIYSVSILNNTIDSLMIGVLSTSEQLGFYDSSLKLAHGITILLVVANQVLAPIYSKLYSENRILEIREKAILFGRILSPLALVILLIYFFWGADILGLWGEEFQESYSILLVLSFGAFVSVAAGSTSMILTMTNHEKIVQNSSLVFLLVNVGLNFFMIRSLGAFGASVATTFIIVIQNAFWSYSIKKKLGINIYV